MARYELLERIGMGGMAEIFRGVATAGGGFEKPVAIKRILPHLSQDHRFIELLIAEAKILSELHHRNIVQIYDVGLGDDGQYFLVMEFVDGTDLRQVYEHLFDGQRLPVEVALHICSEICEALEHAHIAKDAEGNPLGLVHRDVSPSNVLLSKSGEVKLTDFGIAKRMEEVTGHGGVRGKFAYISPEQAVNQHVDARSDVYSVGILLYELVCGQRLFSGLGDFDALREVRQGRVKPSARHVAGVPAELAQIVMKALSKEPADRYASAGEFGSALRGYRYSLETEIADPAAEIASLVAREGRVVERADSGDDFEGGSTIVRINTAAEFNLTDLSGLHQLVNSYPEPKIGDIGDSGVGGSFTSDPMDDEKTVARAHPLLEDGEATTVSAPVVLPPDDAAVARLLPGVGPVDDANEPTESRPAASAISTMPPPKSPKASFPDAALPRPGRAKSVAPMEVPAGVRDGAALPAAYAAAPAAHLEGASIPPHYPGYAGKPAGFLGAEAEARRRRIRIGLIAGALAVLAIVIVGHLTGSGEAAQAVAVEGDAGAESIADGGAPAAVPDAGSLDAAVETPKARGKRPKVRRKKRRNTKRRKTRRKKKRR